MVDIISELSLESRLGSKKIYILMSGSDDPISKAIQFVAKAEFSHASLVIDGVQYGYDMSSPVNGYGGGLVIENRLEFEGSRYALYSMNVTAETHERIKLGLLRMLATREKTRYSYFGLINALFRKEILKPKTDWNLVCSTFVAYVLKAAGVSLLGEDRNVSTIRPMDLIESKLLKFERKGLFKSGKLEAVDAEALMNAADCVCTDPSEAQIEAGNYKKGHVEIHGLKVTIENPRGSVRKGVGEDGKAWESKMYHHYGYVTGTNGADGDEVDVFIGKALSSEKVFVIDQVNADGEFDEHKVMLCFKDEESAKKGYLDNYEEGWTGLGEIHEIDINRFKTWLDSKDTTKEFSMEFIDVPNFGVEFAKLLEEHSHSLEGNSNYSPLESEDHPGWYRAPGFPYFLANRNGELMNVKTGYTTKGSKDDKGYMRACIWNNEKESKRDVKVHVVVCSAFHGPQPKDCEVGHKDDNRSNNVPDNLSWVTRQENMEQRHSLESKAVYLDW